MESFREMYERCYMQREDKLNQLKVWQFLIFVDHSCELWCFLGPSSRLMLGWKTLKCKDYFHKCRPWPVLGRARWRTATKRRRRNTARQRWPTLTLLQKHPDRFRKRRWTWISLSLYLILQWLKVSTFSFFRWRMAPLLPQDRPWNQSEGTNRQPFCQWQLKVQVTCRDPNGLG